LAAKDRDIMAQYQESGVFGGCRPREQREQAADADEGQIQQAQTS
jgi:hypothetical protein